MEGFWCKTQMSAVAYLLYPEASQNSFLGIGSLSKVNELYIKAAGSNWEAQDNKFSDPNLQSFLVICNATLVGLKQFLGN